MKKTNTTKIHGKEIARIPDQNGDYLALNSGELTGQKNDDLHVETVVPIGKGYDRQRFEQFCREQVKKANQP